MDYSFSSDPKYGEVLRIKGQDDVDLERGNAVIEKESEDQIVTDKFFVEKQIKYKEDSAGNKYAWYQIRNHYQNIDKFTPGIKATEIEITELEIDSMIQEQALTDLEIAFMESQEKNQT